ncbi:MAG: hypothetical protein ISQ14_01875, partial [Verrucomicrobiae bacterium]|nr:hypothetical protein [Verrucomicrobiae bacterium]
MKTATAIALLTGVLSCTSADSNSFQNAVASARGWLDAAPEQRAKFEPVLKSFEGDIDAVIAEVRPKGSPNHPKTLGREVKGDTFVVPKLLARNEDHPFTYYVPP